MGEATSGLASQRAAATPATDVRHVPGRSYFAAAHDRAQPGGDRGAAAAAGWLCPFGNLAVRQNWETKPRTRGAEVCRTRCGISSDSGAAACRAADRVARPGTAGNPVATNQGGTYLPLAK
jgi:hypothetical protein